MAKARIRRKDLKAPDEFLSLTGRVVQWARARSKIVIGVAVAIVVVVGVLSLNAAFRTAREREANNDLGRGLSAMRNPDLSSAITQLGQTADRWRPSLTADLASLLAANAEIRAGDLDKALKGVERVSSAAGDLPPYLQQQLHYVWAVALEKKGDSKGAADKYQAAAALAGPYRGPALLGEARMRELNGEAEAARTLYRRYVEEFPDMPNRDLVEPKIKGSSGTSVEEAGAPAQVPG